MSRISEMWHHLTDQKRADTDFFDEFARLLHGSEKEEPDEEPDEGERLPPPSRGELIWVAKARSYIGVKEVPGSGDNPVILNWAKGAGGATARDYTHDSIPWCALFVWTVMREAKMPYLNTLWALDGLKYGVRLDGPAVGCIVCFQREGGGHIGFVVGRDAHGNLMVLGGNQSDAVNIRAFDPGRAVGYRWPEGVARPAAGLDLLPLLTAAGRLSTNEA